MSKPVLAALLIFVFLDLFSFARFHYDFPATLDQDWDCKKIQSLEHDHSNFKVSLGSPTCQLFNIHGNNPVWLEAYARITGFKCCPSRLSDNPRLLQNSNMLRLLSVKYVSEPNGLLDGLRDFELLEKQGDEALYLNRRFLPRIRFVSTLQNLDSAEEMTDLIFSPNFDPADTVLLTGTQTKTRLDGEIIESQFTDDLVRLKVKTEEEGFLVFSETWHPGWRVYLDEKLSVLEKPYGFQMGVHVLGRGEHLIEFRFQPAAYFVGKWLSLISLCLMLCFIWRSRRQWSHPK